MGHVNIFEMVRVYKIWALPKQKGLAASLAAKTSFFLNYLPPVYFSPVNILRVNIQYHWLVISSRFKTSAINLMERWTS